MSAWTDQILKSDIAKCGLVSILTLGGCGGGNADTTAPPASMPTAIRVTLSDTVPVVDATVLATATVLSATGAPIAGQPVKWVTSDASIATIDGAGTVTAHGVGTFTVSAQILDKSGAVQVSGSAGARVRYQRGTWYMADSLVVPYGGTWGAIASVTLSGNRVELIVAGSDAVGNSQPGCGRTAPATMELNADGRLSYQPGRIVETTPSQVASNILLADFNNDGIVDVHLVGSGCDIPNPAPNLRDVPKVLLGDGSGGFRESPLASPPLQQHAFAVGVTRPGGPVDIMMMSGLCHGIATAGGDSLAVQYRGANWLPGCAAPGPFIFRGRGDGTFTYDNTSLTTAMARSIVGDGSATVPNIASAVLCDLNNDGANDLVTSFKSAAAGRPAGQVHLNDKSGRFLAAPLPWPVPSTSGTRIHPFFCRDIDGDGRLDLLTAHNNPGYSSSGWMLLHGNGDETFIDATAQAFPGQSYGGWGLQAHIADVNADGLRDLVGAREEWADGGQPPVWFGTATPGVFRNATTSEVPRMAYGQSTVTAWNLFPVTIGTETMLVSRIERSRRDGASQMMAIPLGSALFRVYRRAK